MVGRTPGVPRQEDHAPRDEDGGLLFLLPLDRPDRHRRSRWRARPACRPAEHGPHGLSGVLYAFTSAANNNGSAFAGLSVNTTWYNTALGLAMVFGRFLPDGFWCWRWPDPCQPRTYTGIDRHAADHRPQFVGWSPASPDPGRPHLPPRARAGPDRRRNPLKMIPVTLHRPPTNPRNPHQGGLLDPRMLWKSLPDASQSSIRAPVAQSGDVSSSRWCGVGPFWPGRPSWFGLADRAVWLWLTCCSPTSPRRWPRAAARPRPKPCARPRRDTWRAASIGWRPGEPGAEEAVAGSPAEPGRYRRRRSRRGHPRRRRGGGRALPPLTNRRSRVRSAPVIRESGGDRSAVTGGTTGAVRTGIVVQITQKPGDLHRPDDRAGRRRQSAEDPRTRSRSTSCWPR